MNQNERKYIRSIMRRVHPDLFTNTPYERQCNSESLKVLNGYIDELSRGNAPPPANLLFYVKNEQTDQLAQVAANLSTSGSLAPLFFAFGFINADELRDAMANGPSVEDTNFLQWLRETVAEAVRTAELHDALKWQIRKYRSALEERFGLASVTVGAEYAVSVSEQERQVSALDVLGAALDGLAGSDPGLSVDGLVVQLYLPDQSPLESYSTVDDDGKVGVTTGAMRAHVADDGVIHVVADPSSLPDQLRVLDLSRARTLTRATNFWLRRVRELTPVLSSLLGVRSVWCDTKTEANSQKFVVWAGYVLERREEVSRLLAGRTYAFSLIVHSDPLSPVINFHNASPVLNVRSDCPPATLLQFLTSPTGLAASKAADDVQASRQQEEALLEAVRTTFGAKCVIKICMSDKVLEGARRLLDNADAIKSAVDLRGACLALDDCYELWDSGFISIPYNFQLQELPGMIRLLKAGGNPTAAAAMQQQQQQPSSSGSWAEGVGAPAGAAPPPPPPPPPTTSSAPTGGRSRRRNSSNNGAVAAGALGSPVAVRWLRPQGTPSTALRSSSHQYHRLLRPHTARQQGGARALRLL